MWADLGQGILEEFAERAAAPNYDSALVAPGVMIWERKLLYTISCARCAAPVETKRPFGPKARVYCSALCQKRSKSWYFAPRVERRCAHCSVSFTTTHKSTRVYCAKLCADRARGPRGFTITCARCSRVFTAPSDNRKFCGSNCRRGVR